MILDHNGKLIARPPFSPKLKLALEDLQRLQREVLENLDKSSEFSNNTRGRIVDHRGDPVYLPGLKIGSTIQVRKPCQFSAGSNE